MHCCYTKRWQRCNSCKQIYTFLQWCIVVMQQDGGDVIHVNKFTLFYSGALLLCNKMASDVIHVNKFTLFYTDALLLYNKMAAM